MSTLFDICTPTGFVNLLSCINDYTGGVLFVVMNFITFIIMLVVSSATDAREGMAFAFFINTIFAVLLRAMQLVPDLVVIANIIGLAFSMMMIYRG